MRKNDGIQFYAYTDFACLYGAYLKKAGQESERESILREAYEYCVSHGYNLKAAKLKSELDQEPYDSGIVYKVNELPVRAIMNVCQYVGAEIELGKRKKDIDFMMLCHNLMGRKGNTVSDVIKQTMNLIRNTFSFDKVLFIEMFFASTFWTKLQNIFGHCCKTFLDIVACPNWTKLQCPGWLRNKPAVKPLQTLFNCYSTRYGNGSSEFSSSCACSLKY